MDAADASGRSPIMRAADRQHGETMRVLASRGAEAWAHWLRGQVVILHGLRTQELNGQRGCVVGRGEHLRLAVDLDDKACTRSVQPWNLGLVGGVCFPGDVVLLSGEERSSEEYHRNAKQGCDEGDGLRGRTG